MQQGYNCMIVVHKDGSRWLMCKRKKEPYKGLKNLVGGHIEKGEDHLDAAYRELYEETSLTRDDITLTKLMTFDYPLDGCYVEVFAGQLKEDRPVSGDENDLLWVDINENFFDMKEYAGEGNIGHMLEILKLHPELVTIKK